MVGVDESLMGSQESVPEGRSFGPESLVPSGSVLMVGESRRLTEWRTWVGVF